jgi:hypothetical protein
MKTELLKTAINDLLEIGDKKYFMLGSKYVKFDMCTFVEKMYEKETTPDGHKCGTAACALGTLASMPFYRKKGLFINRSSDIPEFIDKRRDERHTGMNAGAEFFQISRDASDYLFDPGHYPFNEDKITSRVVAERMKRVIRFGGDIEKVVKAEAKLKAFQNAPDYKLWLKSSTRNFCTA